MAERRTAGNERKEHEGKQKQESSRSGSSQQQRAESGRSAGGQADSSDLKQREYRDEHGNVHHHTREYMERQGSKGGNGSRRS